MFHSVFSQLFRGAAACALAVLLTAGCSREATTKKETTVSGPGGETTVTQETTVEKSGENPPPAAP